MLRQASFRPDADAGAQSCRRNETHPAKHSTPQSPHFPLIEFLLQRPEQPFDASVLPRAARIAALLADATQYQHSAKQAAGETCLVIRSHSARLAVFPDRQKQVPEQCPRALIRQCRQAQQCPATMIDEAEDRVHVSSSISFARQIHRPDKIMRKSRRHTMLDLAPHHFNLVAMPPQRIRHKSSTDRHFAAGGITSIEDVRDVAATDAGYQRPFDRLRTGLRRMIW